MKTKNEKTEFLGVRLDERTKERLVSLALVLGISVSTLVRRMVNYIDDRGAPIGRLSAFKDHLKKMDRLTKGYI